MGMPSEPTTAPLTAICACVRGAVPARAQPTSNQNPIRISPSVHARGLPAGTVAMTCLFLAAISSSRCTLTPACAHILLTRTDWAPGFTCRALPQSKATRGNPQARDQALAWCEGGVQAAGEPAAKARRPPVPRGVLRASALLPRAHRGGPGPGRRLTSQPAEGCVPSIPEGFEVRAGTGAGAVNPPAGNRSPSRRPLPRGMAAPAGQTIRPVAIPPRIIYIAVQGT